MLVCEYLNTSYRPDQELLDGQLLVFPISWILDPVKRRAYVCMLGDFREPDGDILEVQSSSIRIPLPDLFSDLD